MKTSRRLVGSSTGDAEMMCGEQQSASAALFTCGQHSRVRAPAAAGLINTTYSDGDEIWNIDHRMWWEMRRKHLRHPHSRLRLLGVQCVHFICILPQPLAPGSWLVCPEAGCRLTCHQRLHRCSVHWRIISDNVTMSGYHLSQTISNRSVTLAPDDSSIHRESAAALSLVSAGC